MKILDLSAGRQIRKLCERVLELDGKATKGPWEWWHGPLSNCTSPTEDLNLIAHYRNNTPTISKALLIALDALEYCSIEPGRLHPANNAQFVRARDALAQIQKLVRGDDSIP